MYCKYTVLIRVDRDMEWKLYRMNIFNENNVKTLESYTVFWDTKLWGKTFNPEKSFPCLPQLFLGFSMQHYIFYRQYLNRRRRVCFIFESLRSRVEAKYSLFRIFVFVSVLDLSALVVELRRNILYFVYVFVSVYTTFIFVFTKL